MPVLNFPSPGKIRGRSVAGLAKTLMEDNVSLFQNVLTNKK